MEKKINLKELQYVQYEWELAAVDINTKLKSEVDGKNVPKSVYMIPSPHRDLELKETYTCRCTLQHKYKPSQWSREKTAQKHANWFQNQLS